MHFKKVSQFIFLLTYVYSGIFAFLPDFFLAYCYWVYVLWLWMCDFVIKWYLFILLF